MADIAAVVGTFLTLTTEWYKNATVHNTASATLLHHLRNLNQFQAHIKDPIDSLFRLYRPRADHQQLDPLLLFQAVRVVHLNASLQDWLYDAGFRPAKRSEVVVVNRRAAIVLYKAPAKRGRPTESSSLWGDQQRKRVCYLV